MDCSVQNGFFFVCIFLVRTTTWQMPSILCVQCLTSLLLDSRIKRRRTKKKWKICYNLEQFEIELLYIITILNYNNYEIILCLFLKSDPRSHNSIYCFLSFSFCAFFLRSLSLTATQIEKCIIVEYPHLR